MTKKEFIDKIQSGEKKINGITKEELLKQLSQYPDEYLVEEGYEGIIVYKNIGGNIYNYVRKIDTGNEKRRIQKILKNN